MPSLFIVNLKSMRTASGYIPYLVKKFFHELKKTHLDLDSFDNVLMAKMEKGRQRLILLARKSKNRISYVEGGGLSCTILKIKASGTILKHPVP